MTRAKGHHVANRGGPNGYADRLAKYDRAALVLLGYGPTAVRQFQTANDLTPDGISGPRTRAALHNALRQRADALPWRPDVEPPAPASAEISPRMTFASFLAGLLALLTKKG